MQTVDHQGAARHARAWIATAALGLAATAAGVPGVASAPAQAANTPAATAATSATSATAAYVAVQPCRLMDTRSGFGVNAVDVQTLQIVARDVCGLPSNASSLAITLTVVSPKGTGYLTAWPASQPRPTASNVNFSAGQVRANGAIIRLDLTGAFRVYTSVPADVVVDVVGAFVPATSATAGRFVSRPSTRVLDSRTSAKFAPDTAFSLPLPPGVPTDAVALGLNVTITESTGPGFVTEYPAGRPMPQASMLNVDTAGETRAAAGIFPASTSGISLYLSGGGHIVVDLFGYFTGPSSAVGTEGLFTATDPTRLLDTRGASPLGNAIPLYPGGGLELAMSQGAALAYDITSVDGGAGFMTAFPAGTERPSTSTVNSVGGGDVVANFAITQVSTRGLDIYSQAQTHALVDLEGWFTGPSATATLPPLANTPPTPAPAPPPAPTPAPAPTTNATFSTCTTAGLDQFNQTRAASGVAALAANTKAFTFACGYALRLAQTDNGLVHSTSAARDAAMGCSTGENIAMATGTSASQLITTWYNSAAHLANITNASYRSAGIGFVVRTDTNGSQTIWGVADFATC